MSKRLLPLIKFILFFSVGGLILYFLYRSQANAYAEQCIIDGIPQSDCSYFQKLLNDFRSVKVGWLLIVVCMYMLSNLSRAARWTMMFKPLGYKPKFINSFGTLMFGYFANLGLPRLGEVLRPVFMSRYEKIKVEKVFGTIVAERALDFLMLVLVVGLAMLLEFDTLWGYISENANLMDKITSILFSPVFILLIVMGVVGVIFIFTSKKFRNSNLGVKFFGFLNGLLEGIRSVFQLKNPGLFIFHTLFIWVMYYLMTRLCFYAFEPTSHLTAVSALLIFTFGTLGIVFPSPGGMGSYHALIMAGLTLYGVSNGDGFSYANIIFFTIQISCNVVFGLMAYLLLPLLNRNYEGAVSIENSH